MIMAVSSDLKLSYLVVVVQSYPFQGNNLLSLFVLGLEYRSIRSLSNLLQLLVFLHGWP